MTFPLTLKVSGSAGIFENRFIKLKRSIFIIMKILYSSIFWIYLNGILKTMVRIPPFCFFFYNFLSFFLSSLFFLSTSICPHCILIYSLYTLYYTDFHSLSLSLSHTFSVMLSLSLPLSLSLSRFLSLSLSVLLSFFYSGNDTDTLRYAWTAEAGTVGRDERGSGDCRPLLCQHNNNKAASRV